MGEERGTLPEEIGRRYLRAVPSPLPVAQGQQGQRWKSPPSSFPVPNNSNSNSTLMSLPNNSVSISISNSNSISISKHKAPTPSLGLGLGLSLSRSLRQLSSLIGSVKKMKLKLLLLCFSTFFLFSFSLFATASTPLSSLLPSFSIPPGKGYTVVINTWKRNELLKQTVSHYASCAGVDSVHIVWSEPDPPSDSLYHQLRQAVKSKTGGRRDVKIAIDVNKEDSLNNRFKEIKDVGTDAIFSIDDDVLFACSSVEFAYSVWHSAPMNMVGFVPRIHLPDDDEPEYGECRRYKYGGWWYVWWMGSYSMVLSKAAFFHKQYLALYTNHMPPSIRQYVTTNRNCEDIAMSFLVANVTGSPPIWVKGKISEIGSTGISSMGGHSTRRSQCLNDFAAIYGNMPLLTTTVKAVDSRKSWLW